VISVLVVNHSRRELLNKCLASIREATKGLDSEIIVVDNASQDGSQELVRTSYPEARLIPLTHNEGFAPAVSRAARLARGQWLLIVNNDATVEPGCLRLLEQAGESASDIGIATAQVRFAQARDTINTAGLEIDTLGIAYDRLAGRPVADEQCQRPIEVFGASGCVSAYRIQMLSEIGGFDESFFAFMEDADVSWRARMNGWRCVYEPRAIAHHEGSATAGQGSRMKYVLVGRNRMRLIAKNATTAQLLRWGWAMLIYDLAYVIFVAATEGTLAPAYGRIQGLAEWNQFRARGRNTRKPVELAGSSGWRSALRMRAAYRRTGTRR
jgi:GT2 family glycosyltransferase